MEHALKFSVIIPVYNAEKYLRECIESVIFQHYIEWELILVDDGSTDSSGAICDEYAKKDRRIIVRHIPNGGPSEARNVGLESSTGDYILFLDSDDYFSDHVFSCLQKYIEQSQADIICGSHLIINRDRVFRNEPPFQNKVLSTDELLMSILNGNYPAAVWGKAYSRESIGNIRFDTDLQIGEDSTFNLLIFLQPNLKVFFTTDVIYNYRIVNSSLTRISNNDLQKRYTLINKQISLWNNVIVGSNTSCKSRLASGLVGIIYAYYLDQPLFQKKIDNGFKFLIKSIEKYIIGSRDKRRTKLLTQNSNLCLNFYFIYQKILKTVLFICKRVYHKLVNK